MRELCRGLAVSPLALAQIFLALLALGDVLDNAEHAARPACLVGRHIAPTMHDAHLAAGPNHPILHVIGRAGTLRTHPCASVAPPVPRVDQRLQHSGGIAFFLWRQIKDSIEVKLSVS